jgi:hypothetical protein
VLEINPSNANAQRVLQEINIKAQHTIQSETYAAQSPSYPEAADTRQVQRQIPQKPLKQKRTLSSEQKNLKKDFRLFTVSLVRLSVFLILLILGISYILAPGVFSPTVVNTDSPSWVDKNPKFESLSRMKELAESFENPQRQVYVETSSIKSIQEQTPVSVSGRLVSGFEFSPTNSNGSPVFGLEVMINGKSILVLHRGYIGHLKIGDKIKVEGIYFPSLQGISSHKIIQTSLISSSPDMPQTGLLRWTVLTAMWMIFSVTIYLWMSTRRDWRKTYKRFISPAVALSVALILSACTMDFTTIIFQDGHGYITLTSGDSIENMDFLRKVPGMKGYLDALARQLNADGIQVTQWQESDKETIFLQRSFSSLAEISQLQPENTEGSWVMAEEYEEAGWKVVRYLALVDTRTLFPEISDVDAQVNDEFHKQMSQIEMNYSVVLPGEIAYHNASSQTNTKLNWRIKMNEKNMVVAEARYPLTTQVDENLYKYIKYGLLSVFVGFTLIFILALMKFKDAPAGGNKRAKTR